MAIKGIEETMTQLGITDPTERARISSLASAAATPENLAVCRRINEAAKKFSSSEAFVKFITRPEVVMMNYSLTSILMEESPLLSLFEPIIIMWCKDFVAAQIVMWEDQELVAPQDDPRDAYR